MYERNAIVLERYFYGIFNFKSSSNLKDNYYNYRKLFECYGNLCDAKEKEKICQEEFDSASKEILKLQKNQEKLYNKSAKYEYSRYIIFTNTSEKTENIEKHLNKVNEDVQKNNEELQQLGQDFVKAVIDYNEKESNLKEATQLRENAQKEYDEIYSKSKACYDEITEELLGNAKRFIKSDNKENRKELQEIFEDNGKNEKNQFDPDVISNTINKSFEIYNIEMDIYLAGHDRISKLFEEIESDSVKVDKHTKYYRDSKAKLDFTNAEKEYIIQFLDNERIGAIYDKKTHRKLMLEACKKFVLDFVQIENLYDIILKEAAGRSTKKIYKENYNKEYLIDLENASVEPSLDTGKMRQDAIAFMNLNYWRASGMQTVYDTFEDIVTTTYEKDLTEFMPQEVVEVEVEVEPEEQTVENVVENIEVIENTEKIEEVQSPEVVEQIQEPEIIADESVEETVEELEMPEEIEQIRAEETIRPRAVYYSSKIALANAIYYSLQTREFATEEEYVEEIPELSEETYEIPEATQEILDSLDAIEDIEENEEVETIGDIEDAEVPEETEYIEEVKLPEEPEDIEEIELPEETESIEEVKSSIQEFEETSIEDNTFDLSKLDEIEDEIEDEDEAEVEVEENEEIDLNLEDDDEYIEDEDEEDSILEIYFSDNEEEKEIEETKASKNNIGKKVGFFKKLVGLNGKEKRKA